jgi:hypothetical protein
VRSPLAAFYVFYEKNKKNIVDAHTYDYLVLNKACVRILDNEQIHRDFISIREN